MCTTAFGWWCQIVFVYSSFSLLCGPAAGTTKKPLGRTSPRHISDSKEDETYFEPTVLKLHQKVSQDDSHHHKQHRSRKRGRKTKSRLERLARASQAQEPVTSRPLLFIGVNSAPNNVEMRKEIRETWMQHDLVRKPSAPIQVRFLIGRPLPGSRHEKMLMKDLSANGDILLLPTVEGYHNLVHKSIAFFRWVALNNPAEFAMKLDDDTFPVLNQIYPILLSKVQNKKEFTYLGDMLLGRRLITTGKWAQNPEVYGDKLYPTYAAGPGYILRSDLVRLIFDEHYEAHASRTLDNEDTNIGVWVHRENATGIPVDYQHIESNEEICSAGDAIAMNLDAGDLSCMWRRTLENKADLCCNHARKNWEDRKQKVSASRLGEGVVVSDSDVESFLRRIPQSSSNILRG